MICNKCNKKFPERVMHNHHIFPISSGGKDNDGRILLHDKCHKELHDILKVINPQSKEEFIKITTNWLSNTNKKPIWLCPICKKEECKLTIFMVRAEDLILHCPICGHREKNTDYFPSFIQQQIKEAMKDDSISKI